MNNLLEAIEDYLKENYRPERQIVIYTGAGGMDCFEEAIESEFGKERFYLPNKIPRIITKYRVSHTGRKYKLFKKVT